MYHCINEARKYIFDKYGISNIVQGQNFSTTDEVIGLLDKTIVLLINQYYLSITVKKELYNILVSAEIMGE